MAARRDAFVEHCLELLAPLGPARARRMFGGHGLYVDDLFVAIVTGERLYLKADAQSAPRFAAAGCEPFVYSARGRSVTLGYWTAPAEALDAPALMQPWARLAMQAALVARATARGRGAAAAGRTGAAPEGASGATGRSSAAVTPARPGARRGRRAER